MSYAEFAPVYRAAGWDGVLPIPPGTKGPPAAGYTGWHNPDPTETKVEEWRSGSCPHKPGECGAQNTGTDHGVALRMPEGVLGVDVDNYGKKHGLATLAKAEAAWGPLPATFISTAREGGSGIRFFRVPAGSRYPGVLSLDGSSDIELIQRGHRYSVVYPSVHPDTGATYTWYGPDSEPCSPPNVDELPELPESWVVGLQSSGKLFGISGEKRPITRDEVLKELLEYHDSLGEPCKAVRERLAEAVERLDQPGARHDACMHDQLAITRLGNSGHVGVITALEELQREFVTRISVDRTDADAEYDRMLVGAIAIVEDEPSKIDPCAEEDERFERDVADKLYRLRVTEEAKTRHNDILAGGMKVPELESAWDLAKEAPEATDWLVEGLVPRTGVIALAAQRKVGKTTVVHKLIKAILDEEMFLDQFQCHKPNGSVCIFDLELPKDKLGYWLNRNGIARKEVYATSLRGSVSHLNLINENHRRAIADSLREKNCALLVVDPLGPYLRAMGADENSATEAGRALDALISLKESAGVDTLLIPLHSGHSDGKRTRGSSVLMDSPDVNISLYRKSQNEEVRQISAEGRDVDVDVLSFTYSLDTGEITMLEGGTPEDAHEGDVLSVLQILENVSGISQNQVVKAMKTTEIGCGPSRAKKALALAIKSKYVRAEATADTPKAPINHYLTDLGEDRLAKERKVMGEAA